MGVRNGTIGTLAGISGAQLKVRLDGPGDRVVAVDTRVYRNLAHAYAMTIHKAQGITVERSHVLGERNMDRNLTYVAMSRHRDATSLYWSKTTFTSRSTMEAQLSSVRPNEVTLDYSDHRSRQATCAERERRAWEIPEQNLRQNFSVGQLPLSGRLSRAGACAQGRFPSSRLWQRVVTSQGHWATPEPQPLT